MGRATLNQTVNPVAITGGTMEIEALQVINEGLYPSLLVVIEAIVLITTFFAIAGIAWLCFEETRQLSPPACRRPEELRRREGPACEARQVNRTLKKEHFVDPHPNRRMARPVRSQV